MRSFEVLPRRFAHVRMTSRDLRQDNKLLHDGALFVVAPRQPRTYYTYIMGSVSGVLYVGVTGDLMSRVMQHKSGRISGFTS
jgi:hypothetical protein